MKSCHSDKTAPAEVRDQPQATARAAARRATSYPLVRDEAEHARLQAQARFWSDDAAALFASAELREGWRVADLGCGTPDVALRLARQVGPHGSVVAIDNDAALVREAAPAANVRLERGDAYATGWPGGTFDAAHARFLAAPAGRLDELLAEMKRIVRPGGVVLLQEPDGDSWSIPDSGGAWPALLRLIRAGFAQRGGNFDAGRELAAAMARCGLASIEQRRVTRTIPAGHAYAALPLAFARQLQELWTEGGLVDGADIDGILGRIREALAKGGNVTTFTLVQCWARVP